MSKFTRGVSGKFIKAESKATTTMTPYESGFKGGYERGLTDGIAMSQKSFKDAVEARKAEVRSLQQRCHEASENRPDGAFNPVRFSPGWNKDLAMTGAEIRLNPAQSAIYDAANSAVDLAMAALSSVGVETSYSWEIEYIK